MNDSNLVSEFKKKMEPYRNKETGLFGPKLGGESNNGLMYTAEYYKIIEDLDTVEDVDAFNSQVLLNQCMGEHGDYLMRSFDNSGGQEGPDDYLGAANLANIGRIYDNDPSLARRLLKYAVTHFGFMNNSFPGTPWRIAGRRSSGFFSYLDKLSPGPDFQFNDSAFIITRMPWILGCLAASSGGLYPLIFRPFIWLGGLVLLYTAFKTPVDDGMDQYRLSWHLGRCLDSYFFPRQMFKLWYKYRLLKDVPGGMKQVADVYYEKGHPFAEYWVC